MLDHESIVRTWMEAFKQGKDKKWMARELNVSPSTLHSRLSYLTYKGVLFPPLERSDRSRYMSEEDIARLNTIILEEKKKAPLDSTRFNKCGHPRNPRERPGSSACLICRNARRRELYLNNKEKKNANI